MHNVILQLRFLLSKKGNIKLVFFRTAFNYTKNVILVNNLWQEIENEYSSQHRFYHNLEHLKHMYLELKQIKSKIQDWDTIIFSMFYHDIVYDPKSIYNEEDSAGIAADRLKQISFPDNKIDIITSNICATKNHVNQADSDLKYFLDADLAILGADEKSYIKYSKSIKKEYSNISKLTFKVKRGEILHKMLKQDSIYKTGFFKSKYETKARQNIFKEITAKDNTKLDNQFKLFQILEKALIEKKATEFVYEWEWEMWFLPTHHISINGESISNEYDLIFEFGEEDLDELVNTGFYSKVSKVEEENIMTIIYKKST